jgi:hypothetical protein
LSGFLICVCVTFKGKKIYQKNKIKCLKIKKKDTLATIPNPTPGRRFTDTEEELGPGPSASGRTQDLTQSFSRYRPSADN